MASPWRIEGVVLPEKSDILRVTATPEDIEKSYAALSRIYSVLEGRFESKLRQRMLNMLDIREGERLLEVGTGTGCGLAAMARAVGKTGKAYGIDITPEMLRLCRRRTEKAGLASRVELTEGEARSLPYGARKFDAVHVVSTLELFDTADIPRVLEEVRRVLKPQGRLGLASLSREGHEGSIVLRIYEWLHRHLAEYASCRPIYVERSVVEAGFSILKRDEMFVGGLFPTKLLVAAPCAS